MFVEFIEGYKDISNSSFNLIQLMDQFYKHKLRKMCIYTIYKLPWIKAVVTLTWVSDANHQ